MQPFDEVFLMYPRTFFHIFLLILMSSVPSPLLMARDVDNEAILSKQSTDISYDIKQPQNDCEADDDENEDNGVKSGICKKHIITAGALAIAATAAGVVYSQQEDQKKQQESFYEQKRKYKEPEAKDTAETVKKPIIVYDSGYDISFFGIENWLHSFDGTKYSKVFKYLEEKKVVEQDRDVYKPSMVTDQELGEIHTPEYLESLRYSKNIAKVVEIPQLAWIPNWLLQKKLLQPVKLATGGTILAAQLAMKHKTLAINLSGGYHHAKREKGEGFCFFADIPLAIQSVRKTYGADKKVLVVDFDAHQGNGVSTILKKDEKTFIIDMYGKNVYPNVHHQLGDHQAIAGNKQFHGIPIPQYTVDQEYLRLVEENLPRVIDRFKPALMIYNAGTDILVGDPVEKQSVTADGIIKRDERVITLARERKIPMVMVLSGGYTRESAAVIGRSISNIFDRWSQGTVIARDS